VCIAGCALYPQFSNSKRASAAEDGGGDKCKIRMTLRMNEFVMVLFRILIFTYIVPMETYKVPDPVVSPPILEEC